MEWEGSAWNHGDSKLTNTRLYTLMMQYINSVTMLLCIFSTSTIVCAWVHLHLISCGDVFGKLGTMSGY